MFVKVPLPDASLMSSGLGGPGESSGLGCSSGRWGGSSKTISGDRKAAHARVSGGAEGRSLGGGGHAEAGAGGPADEWAHGLCRVWAAGPSLQTLGRSGEEGGIPVFLQVGSAPGTELRADPSRSPGFQHPKLNTFRRMSNSHGGRWARERQPPW